MTTTVAKVKQALERAGFRNIHVERGNARGEVVVDCIACWSVRGALAVAERTWAREGEAVVFFTATGE